MDISLIWAMAENRVIGRDHGLPWRLPKDMAHFMATTMGKPVIMGRKSFESMKAALPGRTNIVLTRDQGWARTGANVVFNMAAALRLARTVAQRDDVGEIMVIGGADIYALALPIATKLYITTVHAEVEGDVYFPEFDLSRWRAVEEVHHKADDKHFADYTIATYVFNG